MNISKKLVHQPYQKLKGFLREKNLTYSDVAKTLNISETAVNHKINGISDFSIGEVKKITKAFGVGNDIFFTT